MRLTKALIAKLTTNPMVELEKLSNQDVSYILSKAEAAYHNDQPIISDAIYDIIRDELSKRDPKNNAMKQIGAPVPTGDKKKAKLPFFMGSMDKNKGDAKSLLNFTKRFTGSYVISEKLDGVSALIHVTSKGVKMYTRGDGNVGQDITHLLPAISGVPTNHSILLSSTGKDEIALRGELIMTKKDFEKIQDRGANARNLVSGVVNAKRPDPAILKLIRFVAYAVYKPELSPSLQLMFASECGYAIVYYKMLMEEDLTVETLSNILIERRKASIFEIDGIIVNHDEYNHIKPDGNPESAFAFKNILTQATAEVIVKQIEWNTSKDGYLIPVITFDPVHLSGVTIQRTGGFNGEFISTNKIGPGSRLLIVRSGDVIPYVLSVLSHSASGEPQMPDIPYTWTETGKDIISEQNDASVALRVLVNFFTKAGVPGIREGTIAKLHQGGLDSLKKILNATVQDFTRIEGIQIKTATTLVDNIKNTIFKLNCVTLMDASNAFGRGFGSRRLELILNAFPKIATDQSYYPKMEELIRMDGVQEKTATAFLEGLEKYREFENDIQIIGCTKQHYKKDISSKSPSSTKQKQNMLDQHVVFSGFRNAEIKREIENQGGHVGDTLTKKTTILVLKDPSSTSSKAMKAKEQGVMIIGLDKMQELLKISK